MAACCERNRCGLPVDCGRVILPSVYSISRSTDRLGFYRRRKGPLRFALVNELLEDAGYLVGKLLPVVFCACELHAAFGDLPPQLWLVDQELNLIG